MIKAFSLIERAEIIEAFHPRFAQASTPRFRFAKVIMLLQNSREV
jgi:hypothetical protein